MSIITNWFYITVKQARKSTKVNFHQVFWIGLFTIYNYLSALVRSALSLYSLIRNDHIWRSQSNHTLQNTSLFEYKDKGDIYISSWSTQVNLVLQIRRLSRKKVTNIFTTFPKDILQLKQPTMYSCTLVTINT